MDQELSTLLGRLEIIYEQSGGKEQGPDQKAIAARKKNDPYMHLCGEMTSKIKDLHSKQYQLQETKAKGGRTQDEIKVKHEIREIQNQVKVGLKEMSEVMAKERSKKRGKSKHSPQELERRRDMLDHLNQDFNETRYGGSTSSGGNGKHRHITDFTSSKGGHAVVGQTTRAVEMNAAQRQRMKEIDKDNQEIDGLLDMVDNQLDDITNIAQNMNTTVKKQNIMLDEINEKAEKTQAELANVNTRMKEVIKKATGGSDKFCMYIICLIILLGILTVLYNMTQGNSSAN
eukprot:TRINITY_DN776055_c0_g1_i1.p1 TRINITY_DN776055_c0_g1~~TRINITY_DN776055_c0_g1_i1.p1  ORF type:complete len:287 (-),score=86.68 TRINITY_DN776055_c0_g1_i1:108-968(-)